MHRHPLRLGNHSSWHSACLSPSLYPLSCQSAWRIFSAHKRTAQSAPHPHPLKPCGLLKSWIHHCFCWFYWKPAWTGFVNPWIWPSHLHLHKASLGCKEAQCFHHKCIHPQADHNHCWSQQHSPALCRLHPSSLCLHRLHNICCPYPCHKP